MTARRIAPIGTKAAPASRQRPFRRKQDTISAQRDRLVAEVARLRAGGNACRFVDNAQQLLTRWWSTASWAGRQELLKTVEWLVQLAKSSSGPETNAPHEVATRRS
jgi:hypothetical protein